MMREKMRHWSECGGFPSKNHWYPNGINLRYVFSITLHTKTKTGEIISASLFPLDLTFFASWFLHGTGNYNAEVTIKDTGLFLTVPSVRKWLIEKINVEFNAVSWKAGIVVCKLEKIQEICKLLHWKPNCVVFWESLDHNCLLLAQKWLLDLSANFVFLVYLFNRRM